MNQFFGTNPSREVISMLEMAGYEAVFVGGSVRDHLLGKEASDIDIATSASPEEVKKVFPNTIDVGIEHGTILVIMHNEPIEVTTYRTEGTYTKNCEHDEMRFVKSLKEDLQRRDFTMNALALTLTGDLIDPFGGVADLTDRLIKAVENAENRFQEDALRMLRAVRFSSVLGFDIEQQTYLAIAHNAEKIRHVSVERIKVEMDKLFLGIKPGKALNSIADTGLSKHLPLFPDDVQAFVSSAPFSSSDQAWSIFMIVGKFSAREMASAYKLSKREKLFLMDVETVFKNRLRSEYTIDDYYLFSLEVLLAAEKAFNIFHPTEPTINVGEMIYAQDNLPIRSKDDLQIDGTDLMSWLNQEGGRWVGKWMGKIEKAVLHQTCLNNVQEIKEWFLNEYKCEE